MELRAIRIGYDNVKLRKPGECFDWPDDQPIPRWAQRASDPYSPDEEEQHAQDVARRDQMTENLGRHRQESDPQTISEAGKRRGRPVKFAGQDVPV